MSYRGDNDTRPILVTTARNSSEAGRLKAANIADELGMPFVDRRGTGLAALAGRLGVPEDTPWLVVTNSRLELVAGADVLFYHPGMAKPRIKNLKRGGDDVLVQALALQTGDRVLDCTLGLAADALVSSFVVGDTGIVVGLESVGVLALMVSEGLQTYQLRDPEIATAMQRIEVVHADHTEFLQTSVHGSFDVVYFDPMFENPVWDSAGIRPLRSVANHRPLDANILETARRVAKRRIVIKDRKGSPRFESLAVDDVLETAGTVAYGIIHTDKKRVT